MNTAPLKENVKFIQKGLAQISRHRIMALPTHTAWELIDDLEEKAEELLKQLDRMEAAERRHGKDDEGLH